jgi:hypothetical protein
MTSINNVFIQWILTNKAQVLIMLIVFVLGLIALNYMIEIYAKADLLLNACELCEAQGNRCSRNINLLNFSIK